MKMNRQLQKDILSLCADAYPEHVETLSPGFVLLYSQNESEIQSNLLYLEEHGLLDSGLKPISMGYFQALGPRINAKGLDFLEQDGGVSAILNTITVKLHADTIRDLLEAKIMSSSLPPEEKSSFLKILKELPGEALKSLTSHLVEKGLDAFPTPQAIVGLIQTFSS